MSLETSFPEYDYENDKEILPEKTELPTFSCSICEKVFSSKQNMEIHQIIKHYLLPYECTRKGCKKRFISKEYLDEHINLVHKKKGIEKTWKCTQTEKCIKKNVAFETEAKLKLHQKLHVEKKLKCQYCDKMFGRKPYLEAHERTHTNEKIYPCRKSDCNESFTNTASRKWHEDHHH